MAARVFTVSVVTRAIVQRDLPETGVKRQYQLTLRPLPPLPPLPAKLLHVLLQHVQLQQIKPLMVLMRRRHIPLQTIR